MATRKAKRFASGGLDSDQYQSDAADKAAGLSSTADDKVGFWERLKAGNIDDPKSEAYSRWGAGAGRRNAASAASEGESEDYTPPAKAESPKASQPSGMDERDERDAAREASTSKRQAPSRPVSKTPSSSPKKAESKGADFSRKVTPFSKDADVPAGAGRGRPTGNMSGLMPNGGKEEQGMEDLTPYLLGGPAKLAATGLGAAAAGLGLRSLLRGGAKAGAEAAARSGSRAIAPAVDEVTFLGRSGAQRIAPEAERLASAGSKAKRLSSSADTTRVGVNAPSPKLSGGSAKPALEYQAKEMGRESVTNPLSWLAGPKGAANFKKGGAIKSQAFAKGGAVKSSSRATGYRGYGIAKKV